ncbi:PadR family transcriptional regulator [Aestuariimicrobium kwangyangense]|uniref:PadR family transcriptional regulator n=1 Tax=Aestuariimicrobium kwangyangense TaxID=396389 RepID=UPI0003B33C7C|nr:PadR family transcriptional regulator [Aestuariimicrobium kwangyangense]
MKSFDFTPPFGGRHEHPHNHRPEPEGPDGDGRGPRGRHRRHDGFGPGPEAPGFNPPFGGPGFGRGFGFGPGFGPGFGGPRGRGGRARRGDVRLAALLLIAEEPRNGYQIIQELGDRSEGAWKPSPGAIYPALSQLTDEGLIRETESGGRRLYEITEEGRAESERAADRPAPWEQTSDGSDDNAQAQLFKALGGLAHAAKAVAQTGDEELAKRAAELVTSTRKQLYGLLAEQ